MHEISVALASAHTAPDYIPVSNSAVSDSGSVDPRRYSKFDRSASSLGVGTASLSFGDVLDMLNPLQHIPVISSVYRAITGTTINPVSRVAGDILYSGPLGIATALASGAGAVADNVMESKTGKDVKGSLFASIFGGDEESPGAASTQVAAADTTSAVPAAPAAPTDLAAQVAAVPATAPAPTASTPPTLIARSMPINQPQPGIALNRSKLPYGGVIAPVQSMQEQNMMMALSSATGLRIGNTIYTSRLMNGPHPMPASAPTSAPTTTSATPQAALPASPVPSQAAMASAVSGPAYSGRPVPNGLSDDALILKALGIYQNTAAMSASGLPN